MPVKFYVIGGCRRLAPIERVFRFVGTTSQRLHEVVTVFPMRNSHLFESFPIISTIVIYFFGIMYRLLVQIFLCCRYYGWFLDVGNAGEKGHNVFMRIYLSFMNEQSSVFLCDIQLKNYSIHCQQQ